MIKLVLLGGGHAILSSLERAPEWIQQGVQVTLISATETLTYAGMLPEQLGGVYTDDECTISITALCDKFGVRFIKGAATSLDADKKELHLDSGAIYEYDLLAIDVGGTTPSIETGFLALSIKPQQKIQSLSAWLDTPSDEKRTLLVIGGGAVGVEVVLNLSARYQNELHHGKLAIHLVEKLYRLLPNLPRKASIAVSHELKKRGVHVHTACKLIEPTETGWILSDASEIEADRILWTSGIVGHEWIRSSSLKTSDRGFILTSRTMQSVSHPTVFAAGDCALVKEFEKVPKVGVHALQQGIVLAANLNRAIQKRLGKPLLREASYRPFPFAPMLLSTGEQKAIVIIGQLSFTSTLALHIKHYLDKAWVKSYKPEALEKQSVFMLADKRAALHIE